MSAINDGQLYAQARQYDASIGRFVSEDLVKGDGFQPFTLNAYTYCWNDPLNLIDLDGLEPEYIGYIYYIIGACGFVYRGSTSQSLNARFRGHRHQRMIDKPTTQIYFRRVTANPANRGEMTLRRFNNQALRSSEQTSIVRHRHRHRHNNRPLANERNAATEANRRLWQKQHKPRVGPSQRHQVHPLAILFIIPSAIDFNYQMQTANAVRAPYVLENAHGSFTLAFYRNRWGRKTSFYRNYISGEYVGQMIPISSGEFARYRSLAEDFWGYTNWLGTWFPGIFRQYLPNLSMM